MSCIYQVCFQIIFDHSLYSVVDYIYHRHQIYHTPIHTLVTNLQCGSVFSLVYQFFTGKAWPKVEKEREKN